MTPPAKKTDTAAKKTAAKKTAAKKGTALAVAGAPDLGKLAKVAKNALVDPKRPEGRTWYPTGATAFDAMIANGHQNVIGGFPAGTVIELAGEESTGKTTLALQSAARMQRQQGKLIVYLDYERSFDEVYAQKLGLDTTPFMDTDGNYLGGLFWLIEPEYMEQGFQIMDNLCRHEQLKDMIGMFIVDSVAAQRSMHDKVTQTESKEATVDQKKAYEGFDRLGLVAAQMGRFLPTTQRLLKQTTGVLVLINQVRHNVDANSYEKWVTPGGKTIKHVASIRLLLHKGDKISGTVLDPMTGERKPGAIGHWVRIQVKKNKVTGEYYRPIMLPIVANLGVYNVLSCVHIGIALKVVKGSGHYTVPAATMGTPEDIKGQGALGLAKAIVENPAWAARFEEVVGGALRANFELMRHEAVSGRTLGTASEDEDVIDVDVDVVEEVDEG
jgi:recombination protein RecA